MLPLINSSYFKDLLESFSYGVIIFNAMEQAYAVNTIATRILGRPPEKCVGKGPEELLGRMDNFMAIKALLDACRSEGACPKPVDTCLEVPGGIKMHISLSASLLIENKKIFGILISMHDNTHIYELHEREKSIIEQNNRLQRERAESVLQLSRAMAHQIRNPVMSIGGFAKLLQRKLANDSELGEFATAILEGSQRLEGMVKAFTRFTGIRPGPLEAVDLQLLLLSALETSRKVVQDARYDVEVQAQELRASCVARVDPALVLQAVELLVRNSIEAGADKVLLRARPCPAGVTTGRDHEQAAGAGPPDAQGQDIPSDEDLAVFSGQKEQTAQELETNTRCCLEVEDNGPGIQQENLPFLFDPFFSTRPESAGMGLCTAQRIAQELGGSLRIENLEQGGVLARLRLPRVK